MKRLWCINLECKNFEFHLAVLGTHNFRHWYDQFLNLTHNPPLLFFRTYASSTKCRGNTLREALLLSETLRERVTLRTVATVSLTGVTLRTVATASASAIDGNRLLYERLCQRVASRREDCDPLTALRLHELPLR